MSDLRNDLAHPIQAAADPAANPPSRHRILTAALYIGFAVIATASNLGSQWLTVRLLALDAAITRLLGPQLPAYLGLVVGTGVGVIVKFLLDRAFIFQGQAQRKAVAHQARLYLATSVVTTVIYWGGEGAAIALLGKDDMVGPRVCSDHALRCLSLLGSINTYLVAGGVALAIGYVVKYQLDKRITFA